MNDPTNEHFLKTIDAIQATVSRLEEDVVRKKRMANELASMAGIEAVYSIEEPKQAAPATDVVRRDMYYGQDIADAAKDVLERRKARSAGAAQFDDLYDALKAGGYEFETKTPAGEKRALRICLSKNALFHKLPNGTYGLRKWYPNLKDRKTENGGLTRDEDEGLDEVDQEKKAVETSSTASIDSRAGVAETVDAPDLDSGGPPDA